MDIRDEECSKDRDGTQTASVFPSSIQKPSMKPSMAVQRKGTSMELTQASVETNHRRETHLRDNMMFQWGAGDRKGHLLCGSKPLLLRLYLSLPGRNSLRFVKPSTLSERLGFRVMFIGRLIHFLTCSVGQTKQDL